MPSIRLIRSAADMGNRGPGVGMRALEAAIQQADIPWLKVGGALRSGEIPWFWCWKDSELLRTFEDLNWPWICGPNVLFANSRQPGMTANERRILDARNCLMIFTESNWYASLIRQHRNRNEAPIVVWPYPITPVPDGPLEPEYDLLIYLKDMKLGRECLRLQEKYPRHRLFIYGHYERPDMIEAARRSRVAAYLSTDDRGPLAAAEIALTGCPLIGMPHGCPWVTDVPGVGICVPDFGAPELTVAIERASSIDRESVRSIARAFFSPERTVGIIRDALEPLAKESCQ